MAAEKEMSPFVKTRTLGWFSLVLRCLPLVTNSEQVVDVRRHFRQGASSTTLTRTLEPAPPVYFILTRRPTQAPTDDPTFTPMPTITPLPTTVSPTDAPTKLPSLRPTDDPTTSPSLAPSEPPNKVERIDEDFGPGFPLPHCKGILLKQFVRKHLLLFHVSQALLIVLK